MNREPVSSCGAVRDKFALLLYGELSFDEEEHVESHLNGCAECRKALDRQTKLHGAIDNLAVEPPDALLRQSRASLSAFLAQQPREGARSTERSAASRHWWDGLVAWVTPAGAGQVAWLRPTAAVALVLVGFLGARLAPTWSWNGPLSSMSVASPQAEKVRYVESAGQGRVQIVLDETRQRTISGRLDDQEIRSLLIGAAKDPADPGLRAETVGLLSGQADASEVRDALIYALKHDQNPGVRLKALVGLKPRAAIPEVRAALTQALLSDENPGVRTEVIDLLTAGPGENLDRQMVGTLQELMSREDNAYVRQRSARVLESMKASSEIY